MKYSTTDFPPKIALLSKHATQPTYYKRYLNKQHSYKRKSRYQHMKSYHEKNVRKIDAEKLQYLYKLRQEAYNDLHTQIQSYNDEFIARMQYMENNQSMPSNESLCSTDTDSFEMQSLVEMFEAGTVKDYSQLIEWEEESHQNTPAYFDDQGQCGDLW